MVASALHLLLASVIVVLLIAAAALTALEGYQGTPTDQRDYERRYRCALRVSNLVLAATSCCR
jgi:hypothetical protein